MTKDLKEVLLCTWDAALSKYVQTDTIMAAGIDSLSSNGIGSYYFEFNTIQDVKINFNGLDNDKRLSKPTTSSSSSNS